MRFPIFLSNEKGVEFAAFLIMHGRIDAPLLKPLPLEWIIKVFPSLRLDYPNLGLSPLSMKSG